MDLRVEIYLKTRVEFSMLTKSGIDWESCLSPWPTGQISKGVGPFAGKADEFLKALESEVREEVSKIRDLTPSAIYIAGYSLAGLFALYSLYKTDLFDGAACCSGSLWYPGFTDYVKTNDFIKIPQRLYMSLGNKESVVKNPVFASVEDKTKEVYKFYKEAGINVKFEMNPGNHITDVNHRVAKGVSSLLGSWSTEGEVVYE